MEKARENVIDMARYDGSKKIHEKCVGCRKVFEHISTPHGVPVITSKCLTYLRPAMWWEEKPIATKKELIVTKTNPKGQLMNVPVVSRICPVATHVSHTEKADPSKVRVGQQKQKSKG
jgi:hypothetical protein